MPTRLRIVVLMGLLWLAAPAVGDDTAFDAQSRAVIDALIARLAQADTLAAEARVDFTYKLAGEPKQSASRFTIAYAAPNRLAIRHVEGKGGTAIADGQRLHFSQGGSYAVTTADQPDDFDAVLTSKGFDELNGGVGKLLGSLMRSDATTSFFAGIESSVYVGRETLAGVDCHRIRVGQARADYDMWVRVGDEPALAKVEPDLAASVAPNSPVTEPKLVVSFANWRVDGDLPAGAFEPPKHPLVGRPAPGFELNDPSGRAVKLSDYRGKVVVLDFWATWCPLCVASMPTMKRVTDRYAARGVVYLAINQQQSAEAVTEHLAAQKLAVTALLDAKADVARRYRVKALPQKVVIGRDGVVRSVHTGGGAKLGEQLDAELKALTAEAEPDADAGE